MSRRQGSAAWLLIAALGCAGAGNEANPDAKSETAGSSASHAGENGASAAGDHALGGASAGAGTAGSAAPSSAAGSTAGAASGGAPAALAGGAAADPTPPDPSITFEWTETQPAGGGQGDCMPGTYSGSFTCQVILVDGDPTSAIEVSGPVVFTLQKSQSGEFLEISDGRLDGFAMLFINFTSALAGKLDCGTNTLDAMAVDGVYGLGDVNALPTGTFEGTLSGMLDRPTATLTGTWSLLEGQGFDCAGPWTATLTP